MDGPLSGHFGVVVELVHVVAGVPLGGPSGAERLIPPNRRLLVDESVIFGGKLVCRWKSCLLEP